VRRRQVSLAAAAAGLALALLLLAGALHRPAHADGAALARIRRRGYLVVGVPLWLPPFGAPSRAGGWQGLDVALARGVAQALLGNALKVRFLPLLPGERRWAVQSGAADLVAAGFASVVPAGGAPPAAPAESGVRLVGPYFTEPLALLVRRGDPVRQWRDLDGRVVAVLPGSAGGAALVRVTGRRATPVLAEPGSAALAARGVALGRYRAVVGGLAVCRALAAYDPELSVQTVPELGREAYWVLVPEDAPELVDPVRRAAAALPSGAALQRRLAGWAAAAAEPSQSPPPFLTDPSATA